MVDLSPVSQQIWDMKYRFKGVDGQLVDKNVVDTWRRVAHALAAAEIFFGRNNFWSNSFFVIVVARAINY